MVLIFTIFTGNAGTGKRIQQTLRLLKWETNFLESILSTVLNMNTRNFTQLRSTLHGYRILSNKLQTLRTMIRVMESLVVCMLCLVLNIWTGKLWETNCTSLTIRHGVFAQSEVNQLFRTQRTQLLHNGLMRHLGVKESEWCIILVTRTVLCQPSEQKGGSTIWAGKQLKIGSTSWCQMISLEAITRSMKKTSRSLPCTEQAIWSPKIKEKLLTISYLIGYSGEASSLIRHQRSRHSLFNSDNIIQSLSKKSETK